MDKELLVRVETLAQEVQRLSVALEQSKRGVAAQARRESDCESIFRGSPVGLALICADGSFAEVNQALCQMVGYTREQLLCIATSALVHPFDRAEAMHVFRRAFQKEQAGVPQGQVEAEPWEARLLRIDGTGVWAAIRLSPPHGAHLVASIENIHRRKLLDQALARLAATLAKDRGIRLQGRWKFDVTTGLVSASAPVCRLFGFNPEQGPVRVEQIIERVHPAERSQIQNALTMAGSQQAPYRFDFRILLPDGTERLASASGEPYSLDEEGRPREIVGAIQEVAIRKRADRAARESERRLRQLLGSAAEGVVIVAPGGALIDVNPAACRLLGYRREQLLGKPVAHLLPAEQPELLDIALAELHRAPEHAYCTEWELVSAGGQRIAVEVSAHILPDARWMATVCDIGERRRTQAELQRYAAQVEDLYENAPCCYHSLDRDGVYIKVNKTELNWLGYTREELLGKKRALELMTEDSQARFLEEFPRFQERGHIADLELEFVKKDGSILPVMMSASALRDDKGNFISSRTTLFDMTELNAAQAKLRQAAIVFEHTSEAIMVTDPGGKIIAVNQSFTRITGYHPMEVIGKNARILSSGRQDNDFYRALWDALDRDGNWQGQIWDTRKDGEQFPAFENISVVKDASGKITNYIGVFSDITAIKQTEEELVRLAYQDALTGLPNRRLFEDRIKLALAHAKRSRSRAALLLLDVDRFKLINDTLGHAAGDQLLKVLADRFRGAIRTENTIARVGGDEFAAILGEIQSSDEAVLLAQKLATLVAEPIPIGGQQLAVTVSIGIAIYPDDAADAETLTKAADMAMYGAKSKGRNTYDCYAPHMTESATETLAIDRALRHALRAGELDLHYQPQISLVTGRIVGAEALIRWNRPGFGVLTPERFIHVAEETDLIKGLGDWVFDTAWRQLQAWRRDGLPPFRVAINLSARQLCSTRAPRLLEQARARLAAGDMIDGHGFDAEITETALQTGAETINALSELRALGLRVALDDFGTGYSSLSSLKRLPIDTLKIDRAFIDGIPDDTDDKAIASAIIAIGHSMGMRVLAEGIETERQLEFLIDQGCDEAQGFLLFKPMPAAAFSDLMRDGRFSLGLKRSRHGH